MDTCSDKKRIAGGVLLMGTNKTLIFEKTDNAGIITLNRPHRMNAFSMEGIKELIGLLAEIENDKEIRSVIIAGQEKFFCTGVDIQDEVNVDDRLLPCLRRALAAVEDSGKPFIAAMSGLALGAGLELALVCDLRVMSDNAEIGLPEVSVGAFPGAGGIDRLPRLIGVAKAKEMILLGNRINAGEAYRLAFANKVVPFISLMDECKDIARRLAQKSPLIVAMDKFAINKGMMMDLQSSLAHSMQCFASVSKSEDMAEGKKAFQEKRKPVWKGK
jgi:enoyl-CoA hydratase/carnithine racemase